MLTCIRFKDCGFYRKWSHTKKCVCAGMVAMYCRGSKMQECKRSEFYNSMNVTPPDDMMPNGSMIEDKISNEASLLK